MLGIMQLAPEDEHGNVIDIVNDEEIVSQLMRNYLDSLDYYRIKRKQSNYLPVEFDKHWYG